MQHIKIIRCSDSMMWYSDKIGQTLPLVREMAGFYWTREGGVYNAINIVLKQDAELITFVE